MDNLAYQYQVNKENVFAEWNTNPIFGLNMVGDIIYVNLAVRAQFPNIINIGKKHLLLIGLVEEIIHLVNSSSEVILFVREINYLNRIYEQQITAIPKMDSIFIYMIDITNSKKNEQRIHHESEKVRKYVVENEHKIQLMRKKLAKIHKSYCKYKEQHSLALSAAEIGTWNWDIVHNVVTFDDIMLSLFNIKSKTKIWKYEDILQLIHPDDRSLIMCDLKKCCDNQAAYHSIIRIIHPDKSIYQLEVRGKIYQNYNEQPIQMAGVCFAVNWN